MIHWHLNPFISETANRMENVCLWLLVLLGQLAVIEEHQSHADALNYFAWLALVSPGLLIPVMLVLKVCSRRGKTTELSRSDSWNGLVDPLNP